MTTEIDAEGLEAFRAWYRSHAGTTLFRNSARQAITAYLSASRSTSKAEPVAEVVKTWTRKDGYNGKGVQWRLEPDTLPLGAKLYTLPTPASDDQVEAVREVVADLEWVHRQGGLGYRIHDKLEKCISALAAMGSTKR